MLACSTLRMRIAYKSHDTSVVCVSLKSYASKTADYYKYVDIFYKCIAIPFYVYIVLIVIVPGVAIVNYSYRRGDQK